MTSTPREPPGYDVSSRATYSGLVARFSMTCSHELFESACWHGQESQGASLIDAFWCLIALPDVRLGYVAVAFLKHGMFFIY